MGILDLLFGRGRNAPVKQNETCVWLTPEARDRGIARLLAQTGDSVAILLIGHFANTVAALQAVAESYQGTIPVRAVLAADLDDATARQFQIDPASVVDLIVGEHHPLASHDQIIEDFAESLTCRSRISFHMTLRDPLLHLVAGDWVEAVLQKLGLQEDEPVRSALITRRISVLQQKNAERCQNDNAADSAAEWFEQNGVALDSR